MKKDVYRSYIAHLRCKKVHDKKYKKDSNNWQSAILANYHDRCAYEIKLHKNRLTQWEKERILRKAEYNTYFD